MDACVADYDCVSLYNARCGHLMFANVLTTDMTRRRQYRMNRYKQEGGDSLDIPD